MTAQDGSTGRRHAVSFAPAPSRGWMWPLGLAGVLVVSGWLRVTPELATPLRVAAIALFAALIVWMLAIAVEFPRLTYRVDADGVTLQYGRLARYRIAASELAEVGRKDLRFSPWASFRFPGLALYRVPYRGDGTIQMCASRSHRDVVVLQARDGARYGCTPADPDGFLAAVGDLQRDVRSPGEKA